jgi:exopolyphosphatase/guanosine-5'-triphosphate,3'-diphosphate pyrophosphatase
LRLGDDVFTHKKISVPKTDFLLKTMQSFKLIIDAYQPLSYMACATSAMREAQNGSRMIQKIKIESAISLEILTGQKEAEIIFLNRSDKNLKNVTSFLYIDVGGGSTELTVFSKKKENKSASFSIGTVRLLENLVGGQDWDEMKKWVNDYEREIQPDHGDRQRRQHQ